MSEMAILDTYYRKKFESPPQFTEKARSTYFDLDPEVKRAIKRIKSDVDKVGFYLQYVYFLAKAHFYPGQYSQVDKNYVERELRVGPVNLEEYSDSTASRHKAMILKLCNWKAVTQQDKDELIQHVSLLVDKRQTLEDILFSLLSQNWAARKECLSYRQYCQIISKGFDAFNTVKAKLLNEHISDEQRDHLISLIDNPTISKQFSNLKKIPQGSKKKDIKTQVEALTIFREIFDSIEPLIEDLEFTNNTVQYYADDVSQSSVTSLQKLEDIDQVTLKLLGFVIDQFRQRQDAAADNALKTIRTKKNLSNKEERTKKIKAESKLDEAKKNVVYSHRMLRKLLRQIYDLLVDKSLSNENRIQQASTLLKNFFATDDGDTREDINRIEISLRNNKRRRSYHEFFFKESLKLQTSVSPLLKQLVFDEDNSDKDLFDAMQYFIERDGNIDEDDAPISFLKSTEKDQLLADSDYPFSSRYKSFLFLKFEEGMRSKKLTLLHSYKYLPIQDIFIPEDEWRRKKIEFLKAARMYDFRDWQVVMTEIGTGVNDKFREVNQRYTNDENPYLNVDEKTGKIKLQDYKTEYSQDQYISGILKGADNITIQEVIARVDEVVKFSDLFVKVKKGAIRFGENVAIYAGLISLATNMGHYKMAKSMSPQLSYQQLLDTELGRLSVVNLKKVNQTLGDFIERLDLSKLWSNDEDIVQSSSDGQKIVVAVNSVLANYSYKYYGKEQGVSVNTFVDDRQSFFHVNVLSSSHREAAYMMEGLVEVSNRTTRKSADYRVDDEETIRKARMHAVDQHGYTDAMFTGLHFINVAFAPRLDVKKAALYTYGNEFFGESCGHKIFAKNKVSPNLIKDQWDQILRLMCSIILGYASASMVMTQLSTSSKSTNLYRAMQHFGRLLKTRYLLSYMDDVDLRKQVQKSLSRAEHGQNFSNAIFTGRQKQFKQGELENMDRISWSLLVVKKMVVLWNYLYVTDYLLNLDPEEDKQEILDKLAEGTIIAWAHVNFTGTYDFLNTDANKFRSTYKQITNFTIN